MENFSPEQTFLPAAPQKQKKPAGSNRAAPAARANFCLLLLPFDPDKIHSMTPHRTQSSSPTCLIIIPQLPPERKPRAFDGAPKVTAAYQRLVEVGDALIALIRRSKGRDNKTLASFAEQLRKLLEKFSF